jgi:hypothetical protein
MPSFGSRHQSAALGKDINVHNYENTGVADRPAQPHSSQHSDARMQWPSGSVETHLIGKKSGGLGALNFRGYACSNAGISQSTGFVLFSNKYEPGAFCVQLAYEGVVGNP